MRKPPGPQHRLRVVLDVWEVIDFEAGRIHSYSYEIYRASSSSAISTSLIGCHHLSPGAIMPHTLDKMWTTARWKSRDVASRHIMYH
jgi:hypothetical protein